MVESEKNRTKAGVWNLFNNFLHRLFGPLVSIALFFMMALTFADVIMRYLFNSPIVGAIELTEFSMAIVIFLGVVLLTSQEGHVTVDLLDSFIPEKIKSIQKVVINLINLAVMAVISWRLWLKAESAADYGDRTEYLFIPLAPLMQFMSIMTGISGLILLFIMINSLKMEK